MKYIFSIILAAGIFLSACSQDSAFDGQWVLDKENSMLACSASVANNLKQIFPQTDMPLDETAIQKMTQTLCENMTRLFTTIDIKNGKFSYKLDVITVDCVIDAAQSLVTCTPQESAANYMPIIVTPIAIENDRLFWTIETASETMERFDLVFTRVSPGIETTD